MNITIEQRNLLKSGQYGLDDIQIDELLNLYIDFDTLMNRINTFQQQHESDNYNSDQLFDFLINNNEHDNLASYLDNLTLNTDTDTDNSGYVSGEDNVGGRHKRKTRRNRYRKRVTKRIRNRNRKSRRNRNRKSRRNRNRNRNRKRTMRGGRGFTISEDLNPIAYKEDEYDQMNNMLNYNPSN